MSPYSWLEEYTAPEEWVGAIPGVSTSTGAGADSFTHLKAFLERELPAEQRLRLVHSENIPFLIREHERKFQYGVSDATIWEKAS